MDIKTVAHLGRYKEIVGTLLRYGFKEAAERLDLPGHRLLEKYRPDLGGLSSWERIRHALEELGPTFVKSGQILSMRHDLIPAPLVQELQKLQDEVAPEPFEAVQEVVEQSLGRPLEAVFAYFEEQPLAAASLAQVHRAMLRGSRQVVAVKVQRPRIRETIRTDFEILAMLARTLDDNMEAARVYNLPHLVEQIRRLMLSEIDFEREVRNMRIMRTIIADQPGFLVPAVFPAFCTNKVLTMELARGRKLKDLEPEELENREALARRGLSMMVKQILEKGFFHADPHPGNFLIGEEGTIALLDWGMVGRLPEEVRFELIDLVRAFVEGDTEEIVDILLEFVSGEQKVDRRQLQNEILEVVSLFHHLPLEEINLGQIMLDTTTVLREQGLVMSADLAIMAKALVTAEGSARLLYPELNAVAEMEPYVRKLTQERYKPRNLRRSLLRNMKYLFRIQKKLPQSLLTITDKIEQGELTVRFRHENLTSVEQTLVHVTNRLILGIVTAALLIASSLIIFADTGPEVWGYSSLGMSGYLLAALLGAYLVVTILRSKKY